MYYSDLHIIATVVCLILIYIGPRYNSRLKCDEDQNQHIIAVGALILPWAVLACCGYEAIRTYNKKDDEPRTDEELM